MQARDLDDLQATGPASSVKERRAVAIARLEACPEDKDPPQSGKVGGACEANNVTNFGGHTPGWYSVFRFKFSGLKYNCPQYVSNNRPENTPLGRTI